MRSDWNTHMLLGALTLFVAACAPQPVVRERSAEGVQTVEEQRVPNTKSGNIPTVTTRDASGVDVQVGGGKGVGVVVGGGNGVDLKVGPGGERLHPPPNERRN